MQAAQKDKIKIWREVERYRSWNEKSNLIIKETREDRE